MSDTKIILLNNKTSNMLNKVAAGVFDEAIKPTQRDAFVAEPSHYMFLAVADDLVVGMASAVKYLHPDKLPSLWINEVGVGDDYLRCGIGGMLMASMLDLSELLGCEGAWLGTETDNIPALALYRSICGFEVDEERGVYFTWDTEPD